MQLEEAKANFIQEWGTLGSKWGINRTMAQVHALLLISPESLSADNIMEELNISRGNANMNLRALIDWGLIRKARKPGERKEFFYAEKDLWKVARQVMKERKRRELEPLQQVLDELKRVEAVEPEEIEFKKMMMDLSEFTNTAEYALDRMIQSEQKWMFDTFIKFLGQKNKDN